MPNRYPTPEIESFLYRLIAGHKTAPTQAHKSVSKIASLQGEHPLFQANAAVLLEAFKQIERNNAAYIAAQKSTESDTLAEYLDTYAVDTQRK